MWSAHELEIRLEARDVGSCWIGGSGFASRAVRVGWRWRRDACRMQMAGLRVAEGERPPHASSTLLYMSSEAVRIESETLNALRERSAQSGEPIVRLAQRYINEGMRLDRHPGIFFRDGRAGRRAVVIGGPDVWEVIAAARSAPERGEQLVRALAERIGTPVEKIRSAIRYYGEFPDEVDRFIAANEQEAEQLERALENERRLLG